MNVAPPLSDNDLSSSKGLYNLLTVPKRTLGCAILIAALNDYRSSDTDAHRSAAAFLYPRTLEFHKHFDWVVSMAAGIDPGWLRHALNRCKPQWDRQRFDDELRARQQATTHYDTR